MYLSVVMPVRNEAEHIAASLDRLLAQRYESGKLEILIVDGMSEDATPKIVQEYVQKHPDIIRYFANPKWLSSAARNVAIQNAKGEAILIVDGHCFPDNENMLQCVDEAFAKSGADCLGRPIVMHEMKGAPLTQWAIATVRESPLGHHPDSFMYSHQAQFSPASSTAIAYRMSIFEKVGLFDETFDAAEDVEMNTRIDAAGLTCYFDPAIVIRYEPRKTWSGIRAQMGRYGRGRVQLWRKHPHTASWKSFAPGVFFFGLGVIFLCGTLEFALNGFAFRLPPFTSSIFFSILGFYFAVLVAESARLAYKQKRWDIFPLLPLAFFCVHEGYAHGILREFFFPKRVSRD